MTPWVTRLLIANVAVFLLCQANPALADQLAFYPPALLVRPWTVVTYMFTHVAMMHIFFNMLSLFFFGPAVEATLGGPRFVRLYFASGLMGAALSMFLPVPVIGASGAIFGVMYAFAHFFPHERIYVWGILPLESRLFVLIMAVVSLGLGVAGRGGNIAHFAHLGGFVGGWLYLRWERSRSKLAQPARAIRRTVETVKAVIPGSDLERWAQIQREGLHPLNLEELDRLRAKIATYGVSSLSREEREFLDRLSPPTRPSGAQSVAPGGSDAPTLH